MTQYTLTSGHVFQSSTHVSQERVRSFGRVGLRLPDLQGDFDLVWISSLRVLLLTQDMIKKKFDKNKHITN